MDKGESFRLATDMALKWLEIHASQRMAMMRFFLVTVAVCIGGYLTALHAGNTPGSIAAGCLLACFALLFKQLDRRTSQLLKLSEDALRHSGALLAQELNSGVVDIASRAESKDGVPTYRQTFNLIYWFTGLVGVLGVLLALARST